MKFSLQGFWAVGKETFTNGDLSIVTVPTPLGQDAYDITGWTVYDKQVFLNGGSTIEGWPTPADPVKPANNFSSDLNTAVGGYKSSYSFSTDVPAGSATGARSMKLISSGNTINNSYGIIHGPYMVSNDALNLEAGNTVEFWWRAAGTGDAYDVYGYLLNVANGNTIELLNETGAGTGAAIGWRKVNVVLPSGKSGTYKFVFISGSYDFNGGKFVGADLLITGSVLQRTIYPPSVTVTVDPMVQAEGDVVTATITTANIGSNIYHWTVTPSSGDVTADDFESGTLSGSVVIDVNDQQIGTATINVAARNDRKNEGSETFNIRIEVGDFNRHVIYNTAEVVTITEPPPRFTINTAGVTNVDEGSTITSYVSTVNNYASGTYYITVLPVTGNVDVFDFYVYNPEVTLVPDQTGNTSVPVSIVVSNDFKTEGIESFKLQIRQDSVTGTVLATTQETVIINDTSRGFVVEAGSVDGTATVKEGENVLVNLTVPETAYGKYFVVVWTIDTPGLFGGEGYSDYTEISVFPGSIIPMSFTMKADYVTEEDQRIKIDIRPWSFWGTPDMTQPSLGSSQIITVKDTTQDKSSILVDQPTGPGIMAVDYSSDPMDAISIKFTYPDGAITGYRIITPDPANPADQYMNNYGNLPSTINTLNTRNTLTVSIGEQHPILPTFKQDTYTFDLNWIRSKLPYPLPSDSESRYIAVDFFAAWQASIPTINSFTAMAEFYRTPQANLPADQLFVSMSIASVSTMTHVYVNGDGYRNIVRFVYNVVTNKGYFSTAI
jgi:hypothetical protein